MTIISKSDWVDFDPDPALNAPDRTQPITVDSGEDFIILCQCDGHPNCERYTILVERRDVQALIAALLEN